MPARAPLLRGLLRAYPGPSGAPGAFTLPSRKVVLEYCETWESSRGARSYIASNAVKLANANPTVEVVVRQRPNKHPIVRAFYTNNREKVISLRNLTPGQVASKVQLLLESSGRKIKPLKNSPVESVSSSVRGIWSSLHSPPKKL